MITNSTLHYAIIQKIIEKGFAPSIQDLVEILQVDKEEIIKGLYKSATPNKYLASFAPFLFQHESHPFSQQLIYEGMKVFVENHVLKYREALKHVPIHFVGSIAYYGQKYIKQALKERGIESGKFVKSPIDNIIKQQIELN